MLLSMLNFVFPLNSGLHKISCAIKCCNTTNSVIIKDVLHEILYQNDVDQFHRQTFVLCLKICDCLILFYNYTWTWTAFTECSGDGAHKKEQGVKKQLSGNWHKKKGPCRYGKTSHNEEVTLGWVPPPPPK